MKLTILTATAKKFTRSRSKFNTRGKPFFIWRASAKTVEIFRVRRASMCDKGKSRLSAWSAFCWSLWTQSSKRICRSIETRLEPYKDALRTFLSLKLPTSCRFLTHYFLKSVKSLTTSQLLKKIVRLPELYPRKSTSQRYLSGESQKVR